MSGSKKPKKVRVGGGITGYNREATLLDDDYRDDYLSGRPVPAALRRNPTRPFIDLRRGIEDFCREAFENACLPDPFSLLPSDNGLAPLYWSQLANRENHEIKAALNGDYKLCALLHCPKEDHSPLWYAARMSVTLVELDIVCAQGRAGEISAAEVSNLSAHLGCEIGRLENEFRLKVAHERKALTGQAVSDGSSLGGRKTAERTQPRTQRILEAMATRLGEEKMTVNNAARLTFEVDKLGSSVAANRKLWTRHSG
ncbi:hypothetical protein [uncultured Roseovarius sp.]|uniref:hypothetical protein n=1 Tax=uncultured Roseovarius sp. TaxID=293344 RepID=UPI00261CA247|nr:hypothetical protein [uncultured Roseovarius sp.]